MALRDGLVQLGNVTNTYAVSLQSAGAAYDLTTPWAADCLQWWRYTTFGTNNTVLQGVWFRGFPAGDALQISRGTTDLTSVLETTNGVTVLNTDAAFTTQQDTISGISIATPGVVTTSAAHGYATGDRVTITKVVGTVGNVVNNQTFRIAVLSSTTYSLLNIDGTDFTTSGTYTSGGQSNRLGPKLAIEDAAAIYKLTLGTSIMGSDNDVLYIVTYKFQNYTALGDVA